VREIDEEEEDDDVRQYDVRPMAGAAIRWRQCVCFVLSGYSESFVRKFWFSLS
jgi:hypothetical protein